MKVELGPWIFVLAVVWGASTVYSIDARAGELAADKDTIALYHFDEFHSPVDGKMCWTRDAGPNKMDVCYINTIAGPTDAGKYGKAVEFDEDSKSIACRHKDKFMTLYKGIKGYTVEMWFYPVKPSLGCLISQENFPHCGYMVNGSVKAIWLQMRHTDGQQWHRLKATLAEPLALNTWHHFAFTWDDLDAMIYVNGELAAAKELGPGEELNLASEEKGVAELRIGSRRGAEWFFKGKIDEVRISKRVRTPEEIAASADRPKTPAPSSQ